MERHLPHSTDAYNCDCFPVLQTINYSELILRNNNSISIIYKSIISSANITYEILVLLKHIILLHVRNSVLDIQGEYVAVLANISEIIPLIKGKGNVLQRCIILTRLRQTDIF